MDAVATSLRRFFRPTPTPVTLLTPALLLSCPCQQSSLGSFSKTPQAPSATQAFLYGGTPWQRLRQALDIPTDTQAKRHKNTHTHFCCRCHQSWVIDIHPPPYTYTASGPGWSELSSNQSRRAGRTFIKQHSITATGRATGPPEIRHTGNKGGDFPNGFSGSRCVAASFSAAFRAFFFESTPVEAKMVMKMGLS